MKRRIVTILVFLLLGAVVNVAVAWVCASRVSPVGTIEEMTLLGTLEHDQMLGQVFERRGFGTNVIWVWGYGQAGPDDPAYWPDSLAGSLPRWAHLSRDRISSAPADALLVNRQWSDMVRGWPLVSLYCGLTGGSTPGADPVVDAGWLAGNPADFRIFPFRPVWPGFAANTLLYAGLLSIMFLGSGATRRFVRSKRGRCIRCGYDLRGDHDLGCPECGWNRETDCANAEGDAEAPSS